MVMELSFPQELSPGWIVIVNFQLLICALGSCDSQDGNQQEKHVATNKVATCQDFHP